MISSSLEREREKKKKKKERPSITHSLTTFLSLFSLPPCLSLSLFILALCGFLFISFFLLARRRLISLVLMSILTKIKDLAGMQKWKKKKWRKRWYRGCVRGETKSKNMRIRAIWYMYIWIEKVKIGQNDDIPLFGKTCTVWEIFCNLPLFWNSSFWNTGFLNLSFWNSSSLYLQFYKLKISCLHNFISMQTYIDWLYDVIPLSHVQRHCQLYLNNLHFQYLR